jgi:hypothetical protein
MADPVAAQLANMAAAITSLATMYKETRGEVAELKTQLAAVRAPPHTSVSVTDVLQTVNNIVNAVPPVSAPVATPSGSVSSQAGQGQGFIPTVAALRADPQLAAQADQLVSDLSANIAGNAPLPSTVKRGLVHSGGDLAPQVKTPWPQDYVLGSGKKLKLFYEDLSIFEWISGYISIVQNTPDITTAHLMMSHLRNLMEDAVFHGWEPVKQAHSVILSSLESGAFTWADELRMAEKRRSAIARASQHSVADLLSRWTTTVFPVSKLFSLLNTVPLWVQPPVDVLHLNTNI